MKNRVLQHLVRNLRFHTWIAKRNAPIKAKDFYHEENADKIFNLLKNPATNLLLIPKFIDELGTLGLKDDDPRLAQMFNQILEYKTAHESEFYQGVTADIFKKLIQDSLPLLNCALENELVIPNWLKFQKDITEIFENCIPNENGKVATYIPQLGQVDPSNWALSICTIDGQRFSLGNFNEYFTIQSVSKPFTYAIALDNLGEQVVHKFVGKEPSGRMFNELILNYENKPHNPMINSGAIVICSLLHSLVDSFGGQPSLVFDNTKNYFNRLAGVHRVGFNVSVYISEKETADRNQAIAYYLKEYKCFPPKSNLDDTLKFYLRCCSLDVNTEALSLMGATLANSGVNPLTSEQIFKAESIKNTLSLMYSCGMYDYSGQFAFEVGLPGKSGVSGAMVIAIPNVMGIGLWSPRLGHLGNSKRCIQFCKELVEKYPYHQYDNHRVYPDYAERMVVSPAEKMFMATFQILSAAAGGHLYNLKRLFLRGINLEMADYDGRTALHLAAVEGHLACVEFLVRNAKVKMDPTDRWGHTPLDEAQKQNHKTIVDFLKSYKSSDETFGNEQKHGNLKPNQKDFHSDELDKDRNKDDPKKGDNN